MNIMEKNYRTKQRLHILEFLKANTKKHITAEEIIEYFKNSDNPISKSTVYRYLDNLVEENIIRKYVTAERNDAACYQYIDDTDVCNTHYHLKCIYCGNLIHLNCEEIKNLQEHIYKEHKFMLDPCKTVLYGTCSECLKN